jgi:NAD(P)-dependent dehydrogenase (short-subunit alcohol dehydrogenase family)
MSISIDLTDRRAIVTGVSSGIGAGIADTLAQSGCDVAGCGLESAESDEGRRFIASIEGYGRRALYQSLDISNSESARSFVEWSAEKLGGIDVVVSNAGRNYFTGIEGASEKDWEANINLNLAAHWRVAQTSKPFLEKSRQPVVIIIASTHAYYTLSNSFPYNVAKAGLVAMVQSIAIEWGPHIRAVGVAPGFIETPSGNLWLNQFPNPAAKRAEIEAIHPVGRMGTPSDVGSLCAFLASPLSSFISGTTFLIDGGRSAVMQDI